jgi:hypothetical protein
VIVTLFVSYTRENKALVRALKDDLERVGRSVWLDHQIHGGERWWQEIIQQIQDAEVFLFALSKDSWRSRPCRAELRYAEQLGVPIIPVRVGPLENLRIPIAEKQIIDYRERNADAVINLIAAVIELSAQPRQLPDPLPTPPEMPFEYLYRIAGLIDVQQIPPDDQGEVIAELRRRLKVEEDDVARHDILLLLKELRTRNELTVPHAAEIDEILSGIQTKKPPSVEGGATRLPPADHWRRSRPGSDPAGRPPPEASSPPSSPPRTASSASSGVPAQTTPPEQSGEGAGKESPARAAESSSSRTSPPSASPRPDTGAWWPTAGSGDGAVPKEDTKEKDGAPNWLTDLINRGGGAESGDGATAGADPRTSTRPSDTPPRARKWWPEDHSGPEPPAAPTVLTPTPAAQPPTPQPPALPTPPLSDHRFALVGTVLDVMRIPLVPWVLVGVLFIVVVVCIGLL